MKIGIEAQRIFRKHKHGMDIYALELIKALGSKYKENQYVVFVKKGEDSCLFNSPNLKIVEVKGYTYADWEQIYLPKAIKKEGVDLMHFTSNTAALNCPVDFVLTLHDIMYLHSYTGGSIYQIAGHYYRKWIVPLVVKRAKRILTVSEYEKAKIQGHFSSKLSICPIYNGIGEKFHSSFSQSKARGIREKYNLPDKFIFILGNKAPKKNLSRALKAFSRAKENLDIKLVLADFSEKELQSLLKSLKLQSLVTSIVLTGYINQEDLPFIYKESLLFVYPSLQESFGIPIIEAMASGTTVLTSNVTAIPEIVQDAAMMVDPYKVNDLVAAMRKLISSEKLRSFLKAKGLQRAQAFSWAHTASQTNEIYHSLLLSK